MRHSVEPFSALAQLQAVEPLKVPFLHFYFFQTAKNPDGLIIFTFLFWTVSERNAMICTICGMFDLKSADEGDQLKAFPLGLFITQN